MRAVGKADGGGGAGNLLHRDEVGKVAHAGTAELLGHGDAEQAERAELLPQVGGELVLVVDGGGARGDFDRAQIAHGGAQAVDFFG